MNHFPSTERPVAPTRAPAFGIGNRAVGDGHPCLVVGEVAQAHEGSLGMAHAFIDAIANAGADAVKFQTHIATAESTPAEPFRVPNPQDASRYEYWRRMEFTGQQWCELRAHTRARGLIFLSSPFSAQAVHLLIGCGIEAWKLGSGELWHDALIDLVADTGKPVILSTGMGSWGDVGDAAERVRAKGAPLALLQCTSKYPTAPEDVGVTNIPKLRERWDCVAGLSDHSGTIFPGLAAVMMGASIIEVHVTLSREMYGPDVSVSVTTHELRELVRGTRFLERMIAMPAGKDAMAASLIPMREAFSRSIVAERYLRAGSTLSRENVGLKKPGGGLGPRALGLVLGRTVARDIARDERIHLEDLVVEQSDTDPPDGEAHERVTHLVER